MCLWVSYKEKYGKFFFCFLKVTEEGVRSISQRYGSPSPDPDPHQNVTDPHHCFIIFNFADETVIGDIHMEQSGKHYTVVFASIVTEPRSELVFVTVYAKTTVHCSPVSSMDIYLFYFS